MTTTRPSQFTTGYQQALSDLLDAMELENLPTDREVAAFRFIADNATDTGTRDTARRLEHRADMAAQAARMEAAK